MVQIKKKGRRNQKDRRQGAGFHQPKRIGRRNIPPENFIHSHGNESANFNEAKQWNELCHDRQKVLCSRPPHSHQNTEIERDHNQNDIRGQVISTDPKTLDKIFPDLK